MQQSAYAWLSIFWKYQLPAMAIPSIFWVVFPSQVKEPATCLSIIFSTLCLSLLSCFVVALAGGARPGHSLSQPHEALLTVP